MYTHKLRWHVMDSPEVNEWTDCRVHECSSMNLHVRDIIARLIQPRHRSTVLFQFIVHHLLKTLIYFDHSSLTCLHSINALNLSSLQQLVTFEHRSLKNFVCHWSCSWWLFESQSSLSRTYRCEWQPHLAV